MVVENYPQLKSNENFLRLQDELAGTENRIAVERRKYNETVQRYNTDIELFPNNIAASCSISSATMLISKPSPAHATLPRCLSSKSFSPRLIAARLALDVPCEQCPGRFT